MKYQRLFLIAFAFVLLSAIAVGLTQAQTQGPDGDGKGSGGPVSAEAIISAAFNYQGVLKENDTPVTGSRNMVFELFNNNTCAGAPLGTVTRNGVAVNNGFFTTTLDFNPGIFNGQELWLQTSVAGTDIGCQSLTAVPYALSLRPGATVAGSNSTYSLWVENTGTGDGIRGYSNATAYNYAGVYASNTADTGEGSGVFGYSEHGSGVYAEGADDDISAFRADNPNGPAGDFTANDPTYGARFENTASGDGLRSYSNTSTGPAWAAVYAYNTGTGSGIWADSTTGYAGYFGDDIFVEGSCTGCLLVYIGLNGGDTALEVGDLVAVNGVEAALAGTATPVLRLEAANAANSSAVMGVVQSAGQLVSSDREGQLSESVIRAEGTVAPGSYFFIAVQGLAQVKLDGPIAAGDTIALANGLAGRATTEGNSGPTIGRAVEGNTQFGLVWVMLNLR